MIFYRWYTGMELVQGVKPPGYLGKSKQNINCDAALYVLKPFHLLVNLYLRLK